MERERNDFIENNSKWRYYSLFQGGTQWVNQAKIVKMLLLTFLDNYFELLKAKYL